VTARNQVDERKWAFTIVGDVRLVGRIMTNTITRVTIQCNLEREAVADAFAGAFVGE
jgi:hypothetical protein